MTDRDREIEAFLAECGWATAERAHIAGDMSSRKYERLSKDGHTAILMNAPTDMSRFVEITKWLDGIGLSAPAIFASRTTDGLVLLEDFGDCSLKAVLSAEPDAESTAFEYCLEVLFRIREAQPPCLEEPSAEELVEWTELADQHIPGIQQQRLIPFKTVLTEALRAALRCSSTVSLRDFHSENLMWLADREGPRKLGLLDYQDAFLTHPVYDLVSLLTDARRWIPPAIRDRVFERYLTQGGDDAEALSLAFAALSAQRNLRILGIFARAGRNTQYISNTFIYFSEALQHPVFDSVRDETRKAFPSEWTSQ